MTRNTGRPPGKPATPRPPAHPRQPPPPRRQLAPDPADPHGTIVDPSYVIVLWQSPQLRQRNPSLPLSLHEALHRPHRSRALSETRTLSPAPL
jgi:hypothetical protein